MVAAGEASPYERPGSSLATPGLGEMSAMLPTYMDAVADGSRDFTGALLEMTEAEVAAKRRDDFARRVRSAGFPYARALADFDFGFQPSVPRAKVEELATLRFPGRAGNVLLVGSPGVGKTHIAVALGVEAVRARKEVRLAGCAGPMGDLARADRLGTLAKRTRCYAHASLLVIDEVGYLGIDASGAELLLQLVSARHGRRSAILTTNVGIAGWADVFGDPVRASAIADRLCHHCTMARITGRSYRTRDLPADGPGRPGGKEGDDGRGRAVRASGANGPEVGGGAGGDADPCGHDGTRHGAGRQSRARAGDRARAVRARGRAGRGAPRARRRRREDHRAGGAPRAVLRVPGGRHGGGWGLTDAVRARQEWRGCVVTDGAGALRHLVVKIVLTGEI